ncbi:MAG TPA: LytR C-terminal domain-containing protein [Actinomycetota bacterium]|nr:LytR C-terminal domain-containing protein [Actinomycetota bacterium]
MGRRSAPEQGPFYRSVATWALPWLLVAVVVGAAVWIAVGSIGGDVAPAGARSPSPAPARAARDATPTPSPTPTPEPTPTPTPEPQPSPGDDSKRREREPREPDDELVTDGVTVQVLNATGGVTGAGAAMGERLDGLGFDVVAVGTAIVVKDRTTVHWSTPEGQPAAEALARRFGWVAAAKPADLSATVTLHVLVGRDEV